MSKTKHTSHNFIAVNDHPDCPDIWYVRPDGYQQSFEYEAILYNQKNGDLARLLAAAPEMLVALDRANKRLKEYAKKIHPLAADPIVEIGLILECAIAKATGES